jgi:hypothetical protein
MEVERASSPEFEEEHNKMETVKTVRRGLTFTHLIFLIVLKVMKLFLDRYRYPCFIE